MEGEEREVTERDRVLREIRQVLPMTSTPLESSFLLVTKHTRTCKTFSLNLANGGRHIEARTLRQSTLVY